MANSTIYHIGTAAATGDATHRVRIVNKSLSWNYENDLPLEANTWHHLTHTYDGVGGYRTLYLDGRKVESAYAGDTSGEFPPFPLGGYSQGGYMATASVEHSNGTHPAWKAFDGVVTAAQNNWEGYISARYTDSGGGVYTHNAGVTTVTNVQSRIGDWLQLELPYKVSVKTMEFTPQVTYGQERSPATGVLVGSNDGGSTWTEIKLFNVTTDGTPASYTAGSPTTIAIYSGSNSKPTQYKIHRLIWLTLYTANQTTYADRAAVSLLRFYGHKENDLIRFPDATNVRKYPDTAMVSNGPQRGYTVSASSTQNSTYEVYNIFHLDINKEWRSDTQYGSGGAYTGSRNLGTGAVNGEWVKIEMPHKIVLSSIDLSGDTGFLNRAPEDFKVYGSNDDTNWTELISETGITPLATPGVRTLRQP